MYHVLDAAMLGIRGSLPEIAALAHKYHFGGVGIPADWLRNVSAAKEAAAIARDFSLQWGLMPMPADFFSEELEDDAFDRALQTLKTLAECAQAAGVTRAYNHVWPSSSRRGFEENFAWHVARLRAIEGVLTPHGITYGLEFLGPRELRLKHPNPFVHTIAGVIAIADAAGGHSGFVFDTWHWYCASRRLDDVYYAAQHVDRMICMHVNDGIAGRESEAQRDLERALPMTTGVIDSASICRQFERGGYQGPVCCEPIFPTIQRFETQPAQLCVEEVARSVEKLRR